MMALHRRGGGGGSFFLSFGRLATFEADLASQQIRVDRGETPPWTVRHLLLDQVVPRLLAHLGSFVLHAAGVEMDGGAILLLGRTGSGKSTLAASLHGAGHALLGDDAMILDNAGPTWTAAPVYRSLRLFPDSAARVLGGAAQLAPVADYTDKWNVVDLPGDRGIDPTPVMAIVLLERSDSPYIRCEPVTGAGAAIALLDQSFALDPTDAGQARQRLEKASGLVSAVPAFRLTFPSGYDHLPAVYQAITRKIHALGQAERR